MSASCSMAATMSSRQVPRALSAAQHELRDAPWPHTPLDTMALKLLTHVSLGMLLELGLGVEPMDGNSNCGRGREDAC